MTPSLNPKNPQFFPLEDRFNAQTQMTHTLMHPNTQCSISVNRLSGL